MLPFSRGVAIEMSRVTQGAGIKRYAPGILRALDAMRQGGSSTQRAVYVSPAEPGLHFVKMQCNDQILKIPSILPGVTFQPGTVVLTGNFAGYTGETIIGYPPSINAGSSLFPATSVSFEVAHSVPPVIEPPACPIGITGRSYLGIEFDGDNYQLATYHDSTRLASLGIPFGIPGDNLVLPQRTTTDVVIATGINTNQIITSNPATGDQFIAGVPWAGQIGPAILSGSFIFVIPYATIGSTTSTVQLYRIPLGYSGDIDETLHKFGPSYHQTGLSISTGIAIIGATSFLLPCQLSGVDRMLQFSSGAWTMKPIYYTVLGSMSEHVGFQSSPGLSVKLGGNGIIRATASAEVEMMQESGSWLMSSSSATVALYTSQSRSSVIVYPLDVSDGTRKLMRIPIHLVGIGCAQPLIEIGPPPTAPLFMIPRD